MSFAENEKKLEDAGRVKKILDEFSFCDEVFYVWYAIDNIKRIIPGTIAFKESGTKHKLLSIEEMMKKGTFPKCQYGIGYGKCDFTNINFSEITKEEKKDFYGRTFISKDIVKEASSLSRKAEGFTKDKIPSDQDTWKKLSLKEFVVLDTETTGISDFDQVVELAAVRIRDGEIIDQFQRYITPTIKMPPKAFEVHGLSNEFLNKNGKQAKEVFLEFKEFLGNAPIVGHNVSFDKKKIEIDGQRCGIKFNLNIAFDTLPISKRFMDMENHKLEGITDRLGLREGLKSHSALDDVIVTFKYATILKNIYSSRHLSAALF